MRLRKCIAKICVKHNFSSFVFFALAGISCTLVGLYVFPLLHLQGYMLYYIKNMSQLQIWYLTNYKKSFLIFGFPATVVDKCRWCTWLINQGDHLNYWQCKKRSGLISAAQLIPVVKSYGTDAKWLPSKKEIRKWKKESLKQHRPTPACILPVKVSFA